MLQVEYLARLLCAERRGEFVYSLLNYVCFGDFFDFRDHVGFPWSCRSFVFSFLRFSSFEPRRPGGHCSMVYYAPPSGVFPLSHKCARSPCSLLNCPQRSPVQELCIHITSLSCLAELKPPTPASHCSHHLLDLSFRVHLAERWWWWFRRSACNPFDKSVSYFAHWEIQ